MALAFQPEANSINTLIIQQQGNHVSVFKFFINAVILLISMLAALHTVEAQEIPYGINDKEKLSIVLRDAKAQLATHASDLSWLKVAGIASHQLANMKIEGASDDAVNYLKKVTEL